MQNTNVDSGAGFLYVMIHAGQCSLPTIFSESLALVIAAQPFIECISITHMASGVTEAAASQLCPP